MGIGAARGIGSAAMRAQPARKELGSRSSSYTAMGLGLRAMCRSGIGYFAHRRSTAHIGRVHFFLFFFSFFPIFLFFFSFFLYNIHRNQNE